MIIETITKNAFWIAVLIVIVYLSYKLMMFYFDNEKKINLYVNKLKWRFKKNGLENKKGN